MITTSIRKIIMLKISGPRGGISSNNSFKKDYYIHITRYINFYFSKL